MSGTLHIVSTPIGNSRDITLRALEVLKSVDVIFSEDTRETRKLLGMHGITARLESLFAGNERAKTPAVVRMLLDGKNAAVVSSRGTPAVSDPGFFLIREAIAAGARVSSVPGPSAVIAALSASGAPGGDFIFIGFLKRKAGKLKKQMTKAAGCQANIVFFESAARLSKTLATLLEIFPADTTRVCVAREMTKIHEEFMRGTLGDIAGDVAQRNLKGEVTVVLSPPAPAKDE